MIHSTVNKFQICESFRNLFTCNLIDIVVIEGGSNHRILSFLFLAIHAYLLQSSQSHIYFLVKFITRELKMKHNEE